MYADTCDTRRKHPSIPNDWFGIGELRAEMNEYGGHGGSWSMQDPHHNLLGHVQFLLGDVRDGSDLRIRFPLVTRRVISASKRQARDVVLEWLRTATLIKRLS